MEGEETEMKQQSRFKSISVFCGSSPGNKSSYKDAAIELGKELVSRNIDLVYGGDSIGLMGLVSHTVYEGARHVIGVIPKTLMPRERERHLLGGDGVNGKMNLKPIIYFQSWRIGIVFFFRKLP